MAKYVDSIVAICGTADEAGDSFIRVDPDTRSLVVTTWEHFLIHRGLLHAVMHVSKNVPDGGHSDIILRACPDNDLHALKAIWKTTGDALLQARTGFVIADEDVGRIEPINMNFLALIDVGAEFWGDPPLSDEGMVAFEQYIPGGFAGPAFDNRAGGRHEIQYEWILPANGSVMIRVVNQSGAPANVGIQINVFENGNKIRDRFGHR